MNVPFLQDTTFTGLISTKNYGTSQDWSQAYNLVQANSATWEESSEVILTVTNYLSTNFVTLCSTDSKGQILSAGVPLHNIFLTSETDSQTLSYTTSSYLLSISNGNTVNLSSINSLFGSVSGKYEDVYSNVVSNSGNWNTAYDVATVYQTNSATYAPKVELRSHSIYSSGDYAVQQGRNVELVFSAPAASTNVTITLPRQDSNDNAQAGDELLIRLVSISYNSTVTIRQYTYTGSLPYLGTFTDLITFPANTPSQTIRLRLSNRVWSLLPIPNLFSPSPIGNITPSTGTFTTLSATDIVHASGGNSNLWNTTYSLVQSNSGSWGSGGGGGTDLASVTNYLSTNNVLVSGLSVAGNISAIGSVISRIPLVFTTLSAYTLSLTDQSDLITINNSLTSFVYIPNDSSVNFGDGSQINISRLGLGTVTVSALAGVTLRSADNRNQLRTQNSTATIVKLSANDWLLFGDIS